MAVLTPGGPRIQPTRHPSPTWWCWLAAPIAIGVVIGIVLPAPVQPEPPAAPVVSDTDGEDDMEAAHRAHLRHDRDRSLGE
jgi:hypothetical protein